MHPSPGAGRHGGGIPAQRRHVDAVDGGLYDGPHDGGGGYAQPLLFSSRAANSPVRGQFVDASGRSYGAATSGRSMTVPKTALAPKPVTTQTITRGGFGETVAKQSAMRTSGTTTHRTMGG